MSRALDWLRRHALDLGLLAPILLVGAWLRFSGLGTQQLYGDDAEYAIVARYLSRDWTYLAYPAIEGFGAVPFVSQPPLMLYLMAVCMRILGPTDLAAVLPSALLGVATLAAVYALGKRLHGRFAGGAAAALLAVLPFHVEMSRKAQLDAGYAFFLVLTVLFLVAWIQSRRESDAAPDDLDKRKRARKHATLAGAAGAAACLAKLPGILIAPTLLACALGVLLAVLARRAWRTHGRETALQVGLGAAPIALGAVLYLGLLSYLGAVTNLWIKMRWQLGRVDTSRATVREIAAFERDASWYFTDPHQSFFALFGGLLLAFALLGGAIALARGLRNPTRHGEHLLVPLLVATLLGFFLWSDRKEGFYLLPFAPFAALYAGQTAGHLRDLLKTIGARFGSLVRRHVAPGAFVAGLALVAVPAYAGLVESHEDFVLDETQQKYFGYGTREAARWIHEQDPDAGQYGTLLGRFTLHWYNEQPTYHWYVDHTYIESQVRAGNMRYVVYDDYLELPHDREWMRSLIDRYNGQPVKTFREGWGELTVYELHA